jgi:hypothetical protein
MYPLSFSSESSAFPFHINKVNITMYTYNFHSYSVWVLKFASSVQEIVPVVSESIVRRNARGRT